MKRLKAAFLTGLTALVVVAASQIMVRNYHPVAYRIYGDKSGNDRYVEIVGQSGPRYFPVIQRTAKTPLGLVDDSLKVGEEGYNHKLLTQILCDLNDETLAKTNSVRLDRMYDGIGPKISKPNLEGLTIKYQK